MKRMLPLWLGLLAFAVVPTFAQPKPGVPMGKIHGHVINPTGAPQKGGTVSAEQTTRAASGPGLAASTEKQGVFTVDQNGEFSGEVPAGTYKLIYRDVNTPENQQVDSIDNVVVTANQTTEQNIDMSRQEYIDKLPPETKKELEELKAKNATAIKANEVIKHLNADLKQVLQDIHDADDATATAKQQLGAGATTQAVDAKADEIKTAKYTDAEQLMSKDTEAKPDAAVLWAQLGQAQLGLKKYDDAITSFKKAVDVNSTAKKPAADVEGMAQAGMGAALAKQNKIDEAQAAFDAAAKANPPQAGFYYTNETKIFYQVGQSSGDAKVIAAQVASADKALATNPDPKNPNTALLYYLKGQGLISAPGAVQEDPKTHKLTPPPGSMEAFQKYLELDPNGQFATDVKGILAGFNQPISSSFKAGKK